MQILDPGASSRPAEEQGPTTAGAMRWEGAGQQHQGDLGVWKQSTPIKGLKKLCELSIPTAPKQNTAKEMLPQGCGYRAPADRQRPKVRSIHQHGIRFVLRTKTSHAREENSIK